MYVCILNGETGRERRERMPGVWRYSPSRLAITLRVIPWERMLEGHSHCFSRYLPCLPVGQARCLQVSGHPRVAQDCDSIVLFFFFLDDWVEAG